jgi:glycosyltransferase involved in cell wall biosynthesis
MFYKYILVTCCKDEGGNLSRLIDSISSQTIRPVLWIIMDDGSTDNTPSIIKEAKEKYDWIQSIELKGRKRDLGLHLSGVMKKGFDHAVLYCEERGLEYNFLGNVDGDLTLDKTFFENLMNEFKKDPRLGIASGGTKNIIGSRTVHAKISLDEPSGGHMLIRRECFEECGGIPISYSVDSVLKAKARLRGWKTGRFERNIATEIRDVGAAEGYWRGNIIFGKGEYYINYNPIHVLIKGIIYSLRKPHYRGIAYTLGYFSCIIGRKKQTDDDEIKQYFWNKWKKRLRF